MTTVQAPLAARHFTLPLRDTSSPSNGNNTSSAHLPFAPTRGTTLNASTNHKQGDTLAGGRITTPLAAPPPPPLYMSSHDHAAGPDRQIRYAGADHTLGPTFSEEEDGDDSAFIASKMAALGLDPNGVPYSQGGYAPSVNSRLPQDTRSRHTAHAQQQEAQRQAQAQLQYAQYQQAQQQQALLSLISHQTGQHQLRDAMALLELQQAQQAAQVAAERQAQSQLYARQQAQQAFLAAQQQPGFDRRSLMQQQQQQQQQQQHYLQQLHLQQQLAALQPQAFNQPQRDVLAARMQANLQARTGRAQGISLDDAELRARFESASASAPSTANETLITPPADTRSRFDAQIPGYPTSSASESPTSPSAWVVPELSSPAKSVAPFTAGAAEGHGPAPSTSKSPKGGRFSQARQEMAAAGEMNYGGLSAILSRRTAPAPAPAAPPAEQSRAKPTSPSEDAAVFSAPAPSATEEKARYTPLGLGKGRPSTASSTTGFTGGRSATASAAMEGFLQAPRQARSISQPLPSPTPVAKVYVVRQPLGPPGEVKELKEKNFQTRMRRQASLNLGMLGRRTESPLGTPVVA